MRCAPEAIVTTRSVTWPSSSPVSAKWPRWLVPIWVSKPSFVRPSGTAITPALLISTWIGPSQACAKARTEARSVRSSGRASAPLPSSAAIRSPLSMLRTASTTWAPTRASSVAVARPMPLVAPVITTVRPPWPGRSWGVHPLMVEGVPVSALREPPPFHEVAVDDEVAPVGGDHLPVAPADRLRRPPAVLDQPGLAHGLDRAAVDRRRPALVALPDPGGPRLRQPLHDGPPAPVAAAPMATPAPPAPPAPPAAAPALTAPTGSARAAAPARASR